MLGLTTVAFDIRTKEHVCSHETWKHGPQEEDLSSVHYLCYLVLFFKARLSVGVAHCLCAFH